MRRKINRWAAGGILLSALASLARGQEPAPGHEPRELADMSLEELMQIRIDEVQGASRYVQKIRQAPASVTVITAGDIRRYGYRTVADALRSLPGVWVTYDRNYSYLGVRGFGFPADYNNRVFFLVDGHRINEGIYDGVLFAGDFILDPDLIDRIEFIRGPGSCLYGSNAFFGVVNILTKKTKAAEGLEVSGGAGSHHSFRGRATWGAVPKEGMEILLSASAYDSRGRDLTFPERGRTERADGESYQSVFGRLRLKDITLQGAFVTREKTVPTGAYETVFPSRRTVTWDDRAFLDIRYERRFEGDLDLLARLFFDGYWYRGDYEYEDEVTGERYLNKDGATAHWWGAEVKLTRPFLEEWLRATLGAEFRDLFRQDQKNYDDLHPRQVYLDSREDSRIGAVYGQIEAAPLPEVRLNAGLRFDHYDTFGGSLNPRVALMANPIEGTGLKAIYGRAFRAPSAYELNYQDSGILQKANPDLNPETIDTFEAILEQDLAPGVLFSLGGFHYRARDLIRPRIDPGDGLQYFDNVGKVCTRGGEVALVARPEGGWRARLSYSYQDARDKESGEWLPNSPKHLVKANLAYPLIPERLTAAAEFQYMSRRRTLAGNHADAAGLVNWTLSSRGILKGLELSVSVYNLFNEKYSDPAGWEHPVDQIEQDGRSFWVKVAYRF